MNSLLPNGAQLRLLALKQGFDPEPTMKEASSAGRLGKLGFDIESATDSPDHRRGKVYNRDHVRANTRMITQRVTGERIIVVPHQAKTTAGPARSTSRPCGFDEPYAGYGVSAVAILKESIVASDVMPSRKRNGDKA